LRKGNSSEIEEKQDEVAVPCKAMPRPAAGPYLFEALQVSEIFETFDTLNEGCEELLELLGLEELLAELLGLELDEADDALCVPVTRTCWFTCLPRSSFSPLSWYVVPVELVRV
jgi:hypothetical protein